MLVVERLSDELIYHEGGQPRLACPACWLDDERVEVATHGVSQEGEQIVRVYCEDHALMVAASDAPAH